MIEYQLDVPMPEDERQGNRAKMKYPWKTVPVGGSFVATTLNQRSAAAIACNSNKRYAPREFAVRAVVENGQTVYRVWRIA